MFGTLPPGTHILNFVKTCLQIAFFDRRLLIGGASIGRMGLVCQGNIGIKFIVTAAMICIEIHASSLRFQWQMNGLFMQGFVCVIRRFAPPHMPARKLAVLKRAYICSSSSLPANASLAATPRPLACCLTSVRSCERMKTLNPGSRRLNRPGATRCHAFASNRN